MIILELTPEETLALRNLIDAAVRSLGMRGAEAAVVLDQKILAAARAYEEQKRPAPTEKGNGGVEARP